MSDKMMKKIIVPIKGKDGKNYWVDAGISGMQSGRQWVKFNVTPTGWDGYALIVTKTSAVPSHDKPEEQVQPLEPDEQPPQMGGEDGPGF